MPIVPELWETEVGRLLWGQAFETSLGNIASSCLYKKIKKTGVVTCTCSPSYLGGWGGRITWTQERGCSELRLCYCTPGWVTEQDAVKKKKDKKILLATAIRLGEGGGTITVCLLNIQVSKKEMDQLTHPAPLKEPVNSPCTSDSWQTRDTEQQRSLSTSTCLHFQSFKMETQETLDFSKNTWHEKEVIR